MVQAQIEISEHTNRIINIIKAKYGVRKKGQAIDIIAEKFEQELMEPELKPEFIEEMKEIEKHKKFRKIRDVDGYFKKMLAGG